MTSKVILYTRYNCKNCEELKNFLNKLKINYENKNIDEHKEIITYARANNLGTLPIVQFYDEKLYNNVDKLKDMFTEVAKYLIFIEASKDYVREFYKTYNQSNYLVGHKDYIPLQSERLDLRETILQEEKDELEEALDSNDLVESFDALIDIMYVYLGNLMEGIYINYGGINDTYLMLLSYVTLIESHFDIKITPEILGELMTEVHRSNMSKLDENGNPIYREDGKIIKSHLFSPPNLKIILDKYYF